MIFNLEKLEKFEEILFFPKIFTKTYFYTIFGEISKMKQNSFLEQKVCKKMKFSQFDSF